MISLGVIAGITWASVKKPSNDSQVHEKGNIDINLDLTLSGYSQISKVSYCYHS